MHFSRLSEFRRKNNILFATVTWIVRIAVAALFVFSGLSKGIDPWGTIFKFSEYYAAMGLEVWDVLNVVGVFLLCLLEFLVGVFLLTGCFRKATPIIGAAIMIVMLPLTLWLAIYNPISDCGCFGDAFHLSNWATFWKNIIISAGIVWLLFNNRRYGFLITPYLQWIATVGSGIYFFIISFLGYNYQPLIDFRPYKIGTPLVSKDYDDVEDSDIDETVYVYEKDGKRSEFTIDDELPDEDDGWVFVGTERREQGWNDKKVAVKSGEPQKNLRFYNEEGTEDLTDSTIGNGKQLILMIPSLAEVPAAKTWKINSLYEWSDKNGIEMIATVGGNPEEIEYWKEIALPDYPIYTSDDTSIKEVVRGNPAVVFIDNGIIKWKSSLQAIDIDDFLSPEISSDPSNFVYDNDKIFRNISAVFLIFLAILILMSLSPRMTRLIVSKFKKSKESQAEKPVQNEENNES